MVIWDWNFQSGNDFGIFQKSLGPHFDGIFGQPWPETFLQMYGEDLIVRS